MDKKLVKSRFSRAAGTYAEFSAPQRYAAEKMVGMLSLTGRELSDVLEIGCGTGNLTLSFLDSFTPERLWLNDLCPEAAVKTGMAVSRLAAGRPSLSSLEVHLLPGDAEILVLPEELDLVVSCSVFQWFENPELFISRCSEKLKHGSILAFSTFGVENLNEVRSLTGVGLKYRQLDELVRTVGRYFTVLEADEEIIACDFESASDVLRHLKNTGVTGISKEVWTKGRLTEFSDGYHEKFSTGGGVSLTYHPVWLVAEKR